MFSIGDSVREKYCPYDVGVIIGSEKLNQPKGLSYYLIRFADGEEHWLEEYRLTKIGS